MMPPDMFDELEAIVFAKFQGKDDDGDATFVEGKEGFMDIGCS